MARRGDETDFMATIQTTVNYFARGYTRLELKPNSPSPRELVDTYALRLWIHDQLVYDQTHSVRNWQMRHRYVENIAQAFRCARELLGKEISCPPENTSSSDKERDYLSLACAQMDADWMKITLSAAPTKRFGDMVHANMYLRQAATVIGDLEHRSIGKWGEWATMTWAIILCTPDDAVTFGKQLLEEIHFVEQERIALGIPEYDDAYYSG